MIVASFIFIIKTSKSFKLALKIFKANNNEVVEDSNSCKTNKIVVNLPKSKKLKNVKFKIYINIEITKKLILVTPSTKETCNRLKHALVKALIFQYFDSQYHIQIETNALSYTIDIILS